MKMAKYFNMILLAIMVALGAVYFKSLPPEMPIHINFNSVADSYASKEMFFILFFSLYTVIIGLTELLIKLSPTQFSMANSRDVLRMILLATGLLIFSIYIGLLQHPSKPMLADNYFCYGVAAFLLLSGSVFGKIEQNFILGIRLPWTLASVKNWEYTHRLTGRWMVICGFSSVIVLFFYRSTSVAIGTLLIAILPSILFSYRYYIKYEKEKSRA